MHSKLCRSKEFSLPIYFRMLRTYMNSGGILDINRVNAALNAYFGSMINWMLYNIEPACTSKILEERDTAIKEINWVLMVMMRLKKLIPDLLKISVEK